LLESIFYRPVAQPTVSQSGTRSLSAVVTAIHRTILCQRKCTSQTHASVGRDVIKPRGSRSSTWAPPGRVGGYPSPEAQQIDRIFDTETSRLNLATWLNNLNWHAWTMSMNQPTAKASSHAGQCIPAGSNVSLPRRVLITASIITMRVGYFPHSKSTSDCLRFAKFWLQFCKSCGTTYQRNWEMFSALQSTSGPLTDGENSVLINA